MENLTRNTFNIKTTEGLEKFQHNKQVLSSFDERTSSNILGIIQANGDVLSRVSGMSWAKQWYVDTDPSLDPLVSTLATTFNTARSICDEHITQFLKTHSNEDLEKANASIGELKQIISELEVIRDGYNYRYGSNPDLTLDALIQRVYRRDPEKTYPAQDASIATLNQLVANYRSVVTGLTRNWNKELIKSIHQKPDLFPELLIRDLSLKKDKEFLISVLNTPNLDSNQKLRIFTLCDVNLQQDPQVLAAAGFVSPASTTREVPPEKQAIVSSINTEQLGKKFNVLPDPTVEERLRSQKATKKS